MNSRRLPWILNALLAVWGAVPATAAFAPPPTVEAALHSPAPSFFGEYGRAVAIDGGTVLIGAPREGTGAVYVYQRVGEGWREQARLVPEDPASTLDFGVAVALEGGTAVVGAPREGDRVEGAVYVFVRQGETWTQQARLTSAVASPQGQFGFSVALFANQLIAGIPWADDRGEDSGAAEVYVWDGGSWVRQARLTAPGTRDGDLFGYAVDLNAFAMVGAPQQRQEAGPRTGAAHLFRTDSGVWRHHAELRAGDTAALDGFGFSVAMSGNVAIAGAVFADPGGVMDAGAAYVFEPAATGFSWRQTAKLVDPTPDPHDGFGFAVGVAFGAAAVGAWRDDTRGGDAGWVHLFGRLPEGAWIGQGSLVSSDIKSQDRFGAALDVSNGVLVVGAFRAHDQGVSRAGQAYVFEPRVRLRLVVQPAQQTVARGADASFIVNVRNTGETRLRNVRVTVPGAPACTFAIGLLRVGERRRVRCTIEDLIEDFSSVVSVRSIPVAGFTISTSAPVEITLEEPE